MGVTNYSCVHIWRYVLHNTVRYCTLLYVTVRYCTSLFDDLFLDIQDCLHLWQIIDWSYCMKLDWMCISLSLICIKFFSFFHLCLHPLLLIVSPLHVILSPKCVQRATLLSLLSTLSSSLPSIPYLPTFPPSPPFPPFLATHIHSHSYCLIR